MSYPDSVTNLIDCFNKLPGIGKKTAERLALSLLDFDESFIDMFSESIKSTKYNIKRCVICNNLTEREVCDVCSNSDRTSDIICVVEEAKNSIVFEKTGTFNGRYHVLDGLISPLDGIGPEDININKLVERIKNENVKEVILALKPSIEGETTCLYISKILSNFNIKVSKIAYGIPIGADIDYLDSLTLEMAIQDRKEIVSNVNI